MVTRLSTMSEKQREDYLKYYNDVMLSGITGFKVLEPAKEYDDFGLRFPIDYLNSFGKNVVFLRAIGSCGGVGRRGDRAER